MPPPQTRSMFMLVSRTDSSNSRYLSLVMRLGKLSAGIQLPPLAKTGTPLITKVKLFPDSSRCCLSSRARRPVRVIASGNNLNLSRQPRDIGAYVNGQNVQVGDARDIPCF